MTKITSLAELATANELERYAQVLVNSALGHGQGISPGDVVLVSYSQSSALLVPYVQKAVTLAGGHLLHEPSIIFPIENDPNVNLIEFGSKEQIFFYPLSYKKSLYDLAQHKISLRTKEFSEPENSLNTIAGQQRTQAENKSIKLKSDYKEQHWQSYTIAYVPSLALAEQSGITLEAFWQQVVKACFLGDSDPVTKVRAAMARTKEVEDKLNSLKIQKLHIYGENCDLRVSLASEARFRSSAGGNMPSYECFVTPRASKTEGWIRFSYPLIYKGNTIDGLTVHFKEGKAESWAADKGQEFFSALMEFDGMRSLGEFALTDRRLSSIDIAIPAAKLYLENIGGTAHVAFGYGYKKCFEDKNNTPDSNVADEHQDMVMGGEFTVTADLEDGGQEVIFQNGQFTFF